MTKRGRAKGVYEREKAIDSERERECEKKRDTERERERDTELIWPGIRDCKNGRKNPSTYTKLFLNRKVNALGKKLAAQDNR